MTSKETGSSFWNVHINKKTERILLEVVPDSSRPTFFHTALIMTYWNLKLFEKPCWRVRRKILSLIQIVKEQTFRFQTSIILHYPCFISETVLYAHTTCSSCCRYMREVRENEAFDNDSESHAPSNGELCLNTFGSHDQRGSQRFWMHVFLRL